MELTRVNISGIAYGNDGHGSLEIYCEPQNVERVRSLIQGEGYAVEVREHNPRLNLTTMSTDIPPHPK